MVKLRRKWIKRNLSQRRCEEDEGEDEGEDEKGTQENFSAGPKQWDSTKRKLSEANVRCGQNERLKTRTGAVGLRRRLRCRLRRRLELELGSWAEQK